MRDTITVRFDGDITLDVLATAIDRFRDLVAALDDEVCRDHEVIWTVERLEVGSALAAVRGTCESIDVVGRAVDAFDDVVRSLRDHSPIALSGRVQRAAQAFGALVGAGVQSITVSPEQAPLVLAVGAVGQMRREVQAQGSIDGRLETVSIHRGMSFYVYDMRSGGAIRCTPRADVDLQEVLRRAWGSVVTVTGLVARDAGTGQALRVTGVADVTPVTQAASDYRRAFGALPARVGTEPPTEVAIRRWRDAE